MENIQIIQTSQSYDAPVYQSQESSSPLSSSVTPGCAPVFNSGDNIENTNNLSSRNAQVEVPNAVEGLQNKYQGLIKCKNINNGNYKLLIVDKNISNEEAQEILEAFKDVNVERLNIEDCCNITELNLSNFQELRNLNARGCTNLESLYVGGCENLEDLDVRGCDNLDTLDASSCKNLETLDVAGCKNLKNLYVGWCTNLDTLNASRCTNLKKLDASRCIFLKTLDVSWCGNLETVDVSGCIFLKTLDVSWCGNLETVDVSGCVSLNTLDVSWCTNLETVNVSMCISLKTLNASRCTNLKILDVSKCTNLETVNVMWCKNLEAVDVRWCQNLKNLNVNVCEKLKNLYAMLCTNLETVNVSMCTSLETLYVNGCEKLKNLYVCKYGNLETVDARLCKNLETVDVMGCTNLKTLNVGGCENLKNLYNRECTNLETLYVNGCEKLKILDVSRCDKLKTLNVGGCGNLETLYVNGCENLKNLYIDGCGNLHGELDISESLLLENINAQNCAEDFVVIISPYCNAATRRNDQHVRTGQPSSFEKYTSILREKGDITAAENIIRQILDNVTVTVAIKDECLKFLKQYCEQHGNMSEEEKTKASEKYISEKYITALNSFSQYLTACRDAFATGFAKLKITLGIGEELEGCKTANERRQVLFSVYAQEQIESSIATFDGKYREIEISLNRADPETVHGIGELLEIQLAMNIIFNVPFSKNMAYAYTAANTAKKITNVYADHSDQFEKFVTAGTSFLYKNQKILQNFLEKVQTKLSLSTEEAQGFTIPLAIILTSMLKDEGVSRQFADRKFNTFLLSEQEYWPLITKEIPENPYEITINDLAELAGETEDVQAIRQLINSHDGETFEDFNGYNKILTNSSTLGDIYAFMDDKSLYDNPYELLGNITQDKLKTMQQEAISNMYSGDNYEQRLVEHLMDALTGGQQQPNPAHPQETDEQIAERLQREEYMQQ